MMRVSRAFSLIDVVIGLLISSLLSIVLYRVFSQTMRIAHVSSGLIEDYSDVLIMSAQLERDISSVVVLKEHEKLAEKKSEPAEKSAENPSEKSSAIELTEGEKKEDSKKEEEQLAFSGIIKDNKLSTLSFVCTNALPQVDNAVSRLVRVRYFLEAEPSDPSLSRLMREERAYISSKVASSSATATAGSDRHAYTIMPNIESITMKFYGTVYTPPGAQKTSSDDTGSEMISLSSWGNEEQRKKLKRLVPEYVEFMGSYRSRATKDAVPFSLFIEIPSGIAARVESREREKQEAKQADKPKGAA